MSLTVGIVGLPNVGKSTLFNAMLKKQQALVANYPFATIEPNVGIVPVPDTRLERLAETIAAGREHQEEAGRGVNKEVFHQSQLPPAVPATVKFVDIAGLVKGANEGEGLGNQFLAHIRETDLTCVVVRAFSDPEVTLTGSGEPKTDLETLRTELILADLQTVATQTAKIKAQTHSQKLKSIIDKLNDGLNRGQFASEFLSPQEGFEIREWFLLTMKAVLYVINVDEAELSVMTEMTLETQYSHLLGVPKETIVVVSAKIEAELATLRPLEQSQYLATLGLTKSGLERLILRAYEKLGLISFLTAGEKECRAWTLQRGETALRASGVIHSDFMKHFIQAEVVHWEKFIEAGGWKRARELGWVRSEGRDYQLKDGEVVEFKIGTG